jgi:hypothetical protein
MATVQKFPYFSIRVGIDCEMPLVLTGGTVKGELLNTPELHSNNVCKNLFYKLEQIDYYKLQVVMRTTKD